MNYLKVEGPSLLACVPAETLTPNLQSSESIAVDATSM